MGAQFTGRKRRLVEQVAERHVGETSGDGNYLLIALIALPIRTSAHGKVGNFYPMLGLNIFPCQREVPSDSLALFPTYSVRLQCFRGLLGHHTLQTGLPGWGAYSPGDRQVS